MSTQHQPDVENGRTSDFMSVFPALLGGLGVVVLVIAATRLSVWLVLAGLALVVAAVAFDWAEPVEHEQPAGVPLAAKVAFWLTTGVVVFSIAALIILAGLYGDFWGGYAFGAFVGVPVAVVFVIALVCGGFGLFPSIKRRSQMGICFSLSPWYIAGLLGLMALAFEEGSSVWGVLFWLLLIGAPLLGVATWLVRRRRRRTTDGDEPAHPPSDETVADQPSLREA